MLLRSGPEHETVWGTCSALAAVFGPLRSSTGGPCRDGATYPVGALVAEDLSDDGESMIDETRRPGTVPLSLSGTPSAVVTGLPAGADLGGAPPAPYYLVAPPGDGEAFQSEVLAAVRVAEVVDEGDSTTQGLVPLLRDLTDGAATIGVLLVVAGLLSGLGGTDTAGLHALSALGADERRLRQVDAVQGLVLTGVAAVGAAVCATVVSQAYLSLASLYVVDWSALGRLGLFLGALVAASGLRAWATAAVRGRADGPGSLAA